MILIEERQTRKTPGITSLFISFKYNPTYIDIVKSIPTSTFDDKVKEWDILVS